MELSELKGVGPRLQEKLERLGIQNSRDLLFHLPLRYQDRHTVHAIGSLRPGMEVVIEGMVENCRVNFGKRRSLLTTIHDNSGALTMRMFHFSRSQQQGIEKAAWIRCFGEVRPGPKGLEMVHPEYTLLDGEPVAEETTATLTPVYPATQGLGQKVIRGLIAQALDRDGQAEELLPTEVLRANDFPNLAEALECLHRPPADIDQQLLLDNRHPARLRLGFEELLAHHLAAGRSRALRRQQQARPLEPSTRFWPALQKSLPFPLTGAQQTAIAEIRADLAASSPAQRLVQGDVGSGKTLVAVHALLTAVQGGYQGALMAPTEVLAEQHHAGVTAMLGDLSVPDPSTLMGERPLRVELLTNRVGASDRRRVLADLVQGKVDIVIGTHALIQDKVEYAALGVVVIDEQHRFGVEQRAALRDKGGTVGVGDGVGGTAPDVLVMTATPIPRTAAMTVYGDLDVSVLDELPPGRTPIVTEWARDDEAEDAVWDVVRAEVAAGRQAYVVCPLIEESNALDVRSAEDVYAQLQNVELSELRVGLLHGRVTPAEKEATMHAFRSGQLDVLVATTVIEVGVDVPNATVMVILDADRFGIAQLHQLRGRVGRGVHESRCFLVGEPTTSDGEARLNALVDSTDGFALAEVDLDLRGEGTIMGERQKGRNDLKLASLRYDKEWVGVAREVAIGIIDADEELDRHPGLADELDLLLGGDDTDFLMKD